MPLTLEQIKESLKAPTKKDIIRRAEIHQERIRFHSETAIDRQVASRQVNDFLSWVRGKLPADKFAIFESLFRFPVKTVKETEKIYEALAKVFDGQNPVFKYDFVNPELLEDWTDFLTNTIELPNFWRTEGIMAMKTAINSVMVVDLPMVQTTERPEPNVFFVDVCNLIDYKCKAHEFDWLIYRLDKQTIVVIDDEKYEVYDYEADVTKMRLLSSSEHDLTYCPARWFWSESTSESDIKKSPITNHLGDLDWLLYYMIAKQHLDLYAGYPIYSAYERDCDYEYEDTEKSIYLRCDGGFLKDQNQRYIIHSDGSATKCPVCGTKTAGGPGTIYDIPQPGPNTDGVDMRNPVQITTIDKKSLDYNVSEEERLKKNIYEDICGYGSDPANDQAMNVKQIMAAFESRTGVLRSLKKNFEQAMEFVEYTIAKLRYGNLFVGCYIDLGTDFYLYESQYLLDLYHTARKAFADQSILDALQYQYLSTRYRNSPDQLKREMMMCHLDPMRHISVEQATELYKDGLILQPDFEVKLKFSTFVMRFEREQAPITEWGSVLSYDERIKRIKKIIYSYVTGPKALPKDGSTTGGGNNGSDPGEGNDD